MSTSEETIGLMRLRDANEALGLAVRLLAGETPFHAMALGSSIGMLVRAIDAGNYVFARRGDRAVGFVCWTYTSPSDAEAWLFDGQPMAPEDETDDDRRAAIILALQGLDKKIVFRLFHALRDSELTETDVVYFLRDYGPNGRERRAVRLLRPRIRGRRT